MTLFHASFPSSTSPLQRPTDFPGILRKRHLAKKKKCSPSLLPISQGSNEKSTPLLLPMSHDLMGLCRPLILSPLITGSFKAPFRHSFHMLHPGCSPPNASDGAMTLLLSSVLDKWSFCPLWKQRGWCKYGGLEALMGRKDWRPLFLRERKV